MLTVGHGTASEAELLALLHAACVRSIIDIRTAPGSRHNPQYARAELERWLPAADIDYRWEKRLGGFRRAGPDSPDVVWRNTSFRGYAEYTRTADFSAALDAVLDEARRHRCAVMCSETVWWRCHRRIVADVVEIAHGAVVQHLMHDGRLQPHHVTDGVRRRDDGLLVYDNGQQPFDL